jgi:hypothetical protein
MQTGPFLWIMPHNASIANTKSRYKPVKPSEPRTTLNDVPEKVAMTDTTHWQLSATNNPEYGTNSTRKS